MKAAIMQPYLFPYLGYFQLIGAVDAFVVYDDVHYIKKGWINRNYILGQNEGQRITLPVTGASQNKLINQARVADERGKFLKTISQHYARAPQFPAVFPMLQSIFEHGKCNLSEFLAFSLKTTCDYLGLNPAWHVSSAINKDSRLKGQGKILAICKELGVTHYINPIGGMSLYDKEAFSRQGIRLSYMNSFGSTYRQHGAKFVPNLSVIDAMMFNSPEQMTHLLGNYSLIDA